MFTHTYVQTGWGSHTTPMGFNADLTRDEIVYPDGRVGIYGTATNLRTGAVYAEVVVFKSVLIPVSR